MRTIYSCPECSKDIFFGKLISIEAICPYCEKLIILDDQSNGKQVFAKINNKMYGRSKLTIEQMHSNRTDALSVGHSHYFTGKPCKNGHISPKTKRGECCECLSIWALENKDKIYANARRWRKKKQKSSNTKGK
jgi:hypothetical protein